MQASFAFLTACCLLLAGCAAPATTPDPVSQPVTNEARSEARADQPDPPVSDASVQPTRAPFVVAGWLYGPDAAGYDLENCGGTNPIYRDNLRNIVWAEHDLPHSVQGWTASIDVPGFAFGFPTPERVGPGPFVVEGGGDVMVVCSIAGSGPFAVHFLPPELAAELEGGWEHAAVNAHPIAAYRSTRQCHSASEPYVSPTFRFGVRLFDLPPGAAGRPFVVEGAGAVAQFWGSQQQPLAAPLGIVPTDATQVAVCNTTFPDRAFVFRVGGIVQ